MARLEGCGYNPSFKPTPLSSRGLTMSDADLLVAKYTWCVVNSSSRLHPVGTLRPNDFGLFDMHGNGWEWCQERRGSGSANSPSAAAFYVVSDAGHRVARSGGFSRGLLSVQSASDIDAVTTHRGGDMGFPSARTMQ